jgi:hypothetical protein
MRTILAEKFWFGFDLNDTLHESRRATGTATNKVLEHIPQKNGTDLSALKDEYPRILKEKTANAFRCKSMSKKIIVITDGPQDAQERTVQALGITPCIDFFATTTIFG